jgi:glucokinase
MREARMAVIGLDLGATKLAGALFRNDGTAVSRGGVLLDRSSGDGVGQLLVEKLRELQAAARAQGEVVEAVAVSVPGIAHHGAGTVWAPNIEGWERYPLRDLLAAQVDRGCPIMVESDRACSILGEVTRGAARGCRHAIFLAVGTGIGAGILVDGSIVRGAHYIAGAIGWMGLDRPYRATYDRCGGFESHASGAGIARVAREYLKDTPGYQGQLRTIEPQMITAHEVFAAHAAGDTLAAKVVANAVECWGMAVANLVSLFDPEIVVLGGGLFGPAARVLDLIVAEARRWAQPVSFGKVLVRTSELGAEACLYGTGELALRARRGELTV